MMSAPLITSGVINASLLVILCIGFNFTYMMEKFPNFAHASYASIGTMITFYLVRFQGFNPYATWPAAALGGGIVGVLLYLGVVKPIKMHGSREITLTFTFYIISQIIGSALAMFSYWLLIVTRIQSRGFLLTNFDFRVEGVPGIGFTAPVTVILLVGALNVFLYRSKYGIAMRATAEDEWLASSLGINVDLIHVSSWFISGALSALAGAILPMWRATSVNYSDELLVQVMAGSVLGGITSISGAILGGFLVATSQRLLVTYLVRAFGVWVMSYEALIPMVLLFLVLAVEPNGLTALKVEKASFRSVSESIRRLRRTLWNLLTSE